MSEAKNVTIKPNPITFTTTAVNGDDIEAVPEPWQKDKLYISGPMSNNDDFNFPAFIAAAEDLRERGYDVVSPNELDDPVEVAKLDPYDVKPENHDRFLERDIKMLMDPEEGITAVVVLPGWERSKGARLEVAVARNFRKPILSYPGLAEVPLNAAEEALGLVFGDRGGDYGPPIWDFTKQGDMMTRATGLANRDGSGIRPDQIPLLMICVKLSRLEESPDHRDSMVDIVGYALTWELVKQAQGKL